MGKAVDVESAGAVKKKTGRPPKDISEKQVYELSLIGCTYREMAAVLGCSTELLHRRFQTTIENGDGGFKVSLRRLQYQSAKQGNVTMLIWLGKQYLGQTDRQETTQVIDPTINISFEKVDKP